VIDPSCFIVASDDIDGGGVVSVHRERRNGQRPVTIEQGEVSRIVVHGMPEDDEDPPLVHVAVWFADCRAMLRFDLPMATKLAGRLTRACEGLAGDDCERERYDALDRSGGGWQARRDGDL
jgi:hypothetical protein